MATAYVDTLINTYNRYEIVLRKYYNNSSPNYVNVFGMSIYHNTYSGGEKLRFENNTDLNSMFDGCTKLNLAIEDFLSNINIEDQISLYNTFYNCFNLTGSPVCVGSITNMKSAYYRCYNLTGSPVCGDNVTDMDYTYSNCYNLTGRPVCGNNVINMKGTYQGCYNLTGSPVCGDNVTDMSHAYYMCNNLTGSPVCGNNVTNMDSVYIGCTNLTGNPVCYDSVKDFSAAYLGCVNLTGSPVCGNNVTDMDYTYSNCYNLTGSPVCVNTVTSMSSAYKGCANLVGVAVIGPNVLNLDNAYNGCSNLSRISQNYFNNYKTLNEAFAECTNLECDIMGFGSNFTGTFSSDSNALGHVISGVPKIKNVFFYEMPTKADNALRNSYVENVMLNLGAQMRDNSSIAYLVRGLCYDSTVKNVLIISSSNYSWSSDNGKIYTNQMFSYNTYSSGLHIYFTSSEHTKVNTSLRRMMQDGGYGTFDYKIMFENGQNLTFTKVNDYYYTNSLYNIVCESIDLIDNTWLGFNVLYTE